MKILNLTTISLLGLLALPAQANQLGLGTTLGSNSNTIAVQYKTDNGFLFEGAVSSFSSTSDFSYRDNTGNYFTVETESNDHRISLGVFKSHSIVEATSFYYGARLGLGVANSTQFIPYQYGGSSIEDESETTSISPTIGINYQISPNLEVALESFWDFTSIDRENSAEASINSTGSQLFVRYYF